MTQRSNDGTISCMSTVYPDRAERMRLGPEVCELGDRADRLGGASAGFGTRVDPLELDGVAVPQSLRANLAAFAADVEELNADLSGFAWHRRAGFGAG